MNIYVGNLAYQVTEDELREAFGAFGEVASASVIKDKFTGRSKGFGFVEMPNQNEAEEAIGKLNGQPLKGRNITVNEARPRTEGGGGGGRGPRGGGGDRDRGGYGGGGRGGDRDRGGYGGDRDGGRRY